MKQNRLPRTWLLEEVQGQEEELDALWSPPVHRQSNRPFWQLPAWFRWALVGCWFFTLSLHLLTPPEVGGGGKPMRYEVASAPEGVSILAWHLYYGNGEGSVSDLLVKGMSISTSPTTVELSSPRSALEMPRRHIRFLYLSTFQEA